VIADGRDDRVAQLKAYLSKAYILEQYGRKNEAAGLYEYVAREAAGTRGETLARERLAKLGVAACAAPRPSR